MSQFDTLFSSEPRFVAYLTAGQRGLDYTVQAAISLVAGGVNVLEIGVPFSDPIADGPVIQEAMMDALTRGITLDQIFAAISKIKAQIAVPIILFSYYNPLFAYSLPRVLPAAKAAGVDGILIVDLPLEEGEEIFLQCRKAGIEPILLLAPETSLSRISKLDKLSNSFLYYVCRNDVTGSKATLPSRYQTRIAAIKKTCKNPIVTGFGIGTPEQVKEISQFCDGFVVGSAIIKKIANGASPVQLTEFAKQLITEV